MLSVVVDNPQVLNYAHVHLTYQHAKHLEECALWPQACASALNLRFILHLWLWRYHSFPPPPNFSDLSLDSGFSFTVLR